MAIDGPRAWYCDDENDDTDTAGRGDVGGCEGPNMGVSGHEGGWVETDCRKDDDDNALDGRGMRCREEDEFDVDECETGGREETDEEFGR